jgi:hypothetical protein
VWPIWRATWPSLGVGALLLLALYAGALLGLDSEALAQRSISPASSLAGRRADGQGIC